MTPQTTEYSSQNLGVILDISFLTLHLFQNVWNRLPLHPHRQHPSDHVPCQQAPSGSPFLHFAFSQFFYKATARKIFKKFPSDHVTCNSHLLLAPRCNLNKNRIISSRPYGTAHSGPCPPHQPCHAPRSCSLRPSHSGLFFISPTSHPMALAPAVPTAWNALPSFSLSVSSYHCVLRFSITFSKRSLAPSGVRSAGFL